MLLHAAAGGIGLIASQWAKHLGATIIGTVGSDEKAALAKDAGCTHVINSRTENFVDRVKEITGGKGVDVVYDGVGKDTFPGFARLPEATRHVGQLRQRLGTRAGLRDCHPGAERLAIRDAADARNTIRRRARICWPPPRTCSTWSRRAM